MKVIMQSVCVILALNPKGLILVLIWLGIMFFPGYVFARVTPEDIVNAKQESYDQKIINYSSQNQQKLKVLAEKIAQINKVRSDQLDKIMETQARILDEYERRSNNKNPEGIKKARYWVTYAHEAAAYQIAKIYIFDLSSEKNIKNDALSTISLFQSDLNSTRNKVIYSQNILLDLVKK